MCSWHLELLPQSKCLGLTASPCSLTYLGAEAFIISPCGWITRRHGLHGVEWYCPIAEGMVNCPTNLDWTGIKNCSTSYWFGIVNCVKGVVLNCSSGKGGTLSCSDVAGGVLSMDLFCILAIATTISHTVSSKAPISSWVCLISCYVWLYSLLKWWISSSWTLTPLSSLHSSQHSTIASRGGKWGRWPRACTSGGVTSLSKLLVLAIYSNCLCCIAIAHTNTGQPNPITQQAKLPGWLQRK